MIIIRRFYDSLLQLFVRILLDRSGLCRLSGTTWPMHTWPSFALNSDKVLFHINFESLPILRIVMFSHNLAYCYLAFERKVVELESIKNGGILLKYGRRQRLRELQDFVEFSESG